MTSLRDLAISYGTDKEGGHSYTRHYETHLGHLRQMPIKLLEIGVGGYDDPRAGGQSLRMWKAYFPQGRIIGLDIHDKSGIADERLVVVQGDQGDRDVLARLAEREGPFDVVIDDGSHYSAHVITSFNALFPHLTPNGVYVIEDLQSSYWPGYQQGPRSRQTAMQFLTGLADGLNYAEYDVTGYAPTYLDEHVVAIHLYHNIAFIQKGDNREPSNTLPPHPHTAQKYPRNSLKIRVEAGWSRSLYRAWARLPEGVRRLVRRLRRRP